MGEYNEGARGRAKRLERQIAEKDEEIASLIDGQADTREALEAAEQRAQRAEAECERLREALRWIRDACDVERSECLCGRPTGVDAIFAHASKALATPPPDSGPEVATTFIGTLLVGDPFDERDGPWMDRKAWKRMSDLPPGTHIFASSEPLDAPHTPEQTGPKWEPPSVLAEIWPDIEDEGVEQAHGDALAVLEERAKAYDKASRRAATSPDFAAVRAEECRACARMVRRHITASGVPDDRVPHKCPSCGSPSPERHPAVQFEGEVMTCHHPWHQHHPGDLGQPTANSVLRSLASWLGVGGYNADRVDPATFEAKIREGVETAIRVETQRASGVPYVPEGVRRLPDELRALIAQQTWGAAQDAFEIAAKKVEAALAAAPAVSKPDVYLEPLTQAGQAKEGDQIIVRRKGGVQAECVVNVIRPGTDREEIVVSESDNRYFLTRLLIEGDSWAKAVFIVRAPDVAAPSDGCE